MITRLLFPSYALAVSLLMPASVLRGDTHAPVRCITGLLALAGLAAALRVLLPGRIQNTDIGLAGLLGLYLGWVSLAAIFVGLVMVILLAGAASSRPDRRVTLTPCLLGAATLAIFGAGPLSTLYASLISWA